ESRRVALCTSLLTNQCTCAATACGQPPLPSGTGIAASTAGACVVPLAKLRTSSGSPAASVTIDGWAVCGSGFTFLDCSGADWSGNPLPAAADELAASSVAGAARPCCADAAAAAVLAAGKRSAAGTEPAAGAPSAAEPAGAGAASPPSPAFAG